MSPRTIFGRTLGRIPIRWRLASVSALMTFMILLGFALVVGEITSNRLERNFNASLKVAAADLQDQIRVQQNPAGGISFSGPDLDDYAGAQNAVIRVVTSDGTVLGETENAPNLGRPNSEPLTVGQFRTVSRPVGAPLGLTFAWVQYARKPSDVDRTIDQMWLLLGAGVIGGALLALLAGMGVARRAMKPISRLTAAAREVGRTRDPAKRLPQPIARDEVTDLSRTLEQMLKSLDEAHSETESVLKAQREFVADASHELRTPLTSVLANLELLQREVSSDSQAEEMIEAALRSSLRMRKLIGDLLLLARTDIGQLSIRTDINLSETVRGVLEEVSPLTKDHPIESQLPDEDVFVSGSSEELHRLVMNLVENALRHTPQGTNVGISLTSVDGKARLEVTDHGPGISKEIRSRIFDRFVTGSGDGEGTGLGLAIVKAVAESHEGRITVDDNPEGGARFVVEFPLTSSGSLSGDRPT